MSDTSRGTPGWLEPRRATQPEAKSDGSLTSCVVVVMSWLVVVSLTVEAVLVDAVELDL